MKPKIELLDLYKEEKALVIGDLATRTGLEPFPSFNEWYEQYEKEYNADHVSVSVKEADALFDKEVEEAEEMFDAMLNSNQENEMNEVENVEVVAAPAEPAVVEVAPVEKPKRTRKTAKAKATPKKAGPNKAAEARKVFNKMYPQVVAGKKARKDIIAVFVSDKIGLTANGASTYYQKFKKAFAN